MGGAFGGGAEGAEGATYHQFVIVKQFVRQLQYVRVRAEVPDEHRDVVGILRVQIVVVQSQSLQQRFTCNNAITQLKTKLQFMLIYLHQSRPLQFSKQMQLGSQIVIIRADKTLV